MDNDVCVMHLLNVVCIVKKLNIFTTCFSLRLPFSVRLLMFAAISRFILYVTTERERTKQFST